MQQQQQRRRQQQQQFQSLLLQARSTTRLPTAAMVMRANSERQVNVALRILSYDTTNARVRHISLTCAHSVLELPTGSLSIWRRVQVRQGLQVLSCDAVSQRCCGTLRACCCLLLSRLTWMTALDMHDS